MKCKFNFQNNKLSRLLSRNKYPIKDNSHRIRMSSSNKMSRKLQRIDTPLVAMLSNSHKYRSHLLMQFKNSNLFNKTSNIRNTQPQASRRPNNKVILTIRQQQMSCRRITICSTWINITRRRERIQKQLIRLSVTMARFSVSTNQVKKRSFLRME